MVVLSKNINNLKGSQERNPSLTARSHLLRELLEKMPNWFEKWKNNNNNNNNFNFESFYLGNYCFGREKTKYRNFTDLQNIWHATWNIKIFGTGVCALLFKLHDMTVVAIKEDPWCLSKSSYNYIHQRFKSHNKIGQPHDDIILTHWFMKHTFTFSYDHHHTNGHTVQYTRNVPNGPLLTQNVD